LPGSRPIASSPACTSRADDFVATIDSCSFVPCGQAKYSIGPCDTAIVAPTITRLPRGSTHTSSSGASRFHSGCRSVTGRGLAAVSWAATGNARAASTSKPRATAPRTPVRVLIGTPPVGGLVVESWV